MLDVNAHEIIHLLKSINNHLQAIRERLSPEFHYDNYPLNRHPGERVLTKDELGPQRGKSCLSTE